MATKRPPLTPSTSYFDEQTEKPSMGDPAFVEGLVRSMFDEARRILFEAKNPQAEAAPLVAKWAKELSPENTAYEQTLGLASLNTFLRSRGYGMGEEVGDAPLKALLAVKIGEFVDAAVAYHESRITDDQLAFTIDATVEDTVKALQGLDNPAD